MRQKSSSNERFSDFAGTIRKANPVAGEPLREKIDLIPSQNAREKALRAYSDGKMDEVRSILQDFDLLD